ncbi:MAG: hypothetical protein AAB668_03355 [Patescibacteria group bacterium]
MAKQKSPFLSSFGTSFQVFKSIADAVLAEGGSDDDLRSLLSDPDKCRRVALEIVGRKPGPLAALEKKFSGEGSVSTLFDGRPWERHSSCANIDQPGKRTFRLAEVPEEFLGKRIIDCQDDLAVHFDKTGERFAIESEAVEFADEDPEAQRKNCILALGSSTLRVGDFRCVALLLADDRCRFLSDDWVGDRLRASDRLLLVRKASSAL